MNIGIQVIKDGMGAARPVHGRRLTGFLFMVICLASSFSPLHAATTISAVDCSQAAVQAAVNLANDGDTVNIPAGNCSWTTAVRIAQGITLQGAGETSTVITALQTDLFRIAGNGSAFRMSQIGLTGTTSFGAIMFDGRYSSLRVDHLTFTNVTTRAMIFGYNNWPTKNPAIIGLIDHITSTNTRCVPIILYYGSDSAWSSPDDWGTANAIYVEDSTISYSASWNSNCELIDTEHGGRPVVRHNTLTGTAQGVHDTGSTPQSRGTRKFEYYANTWRCPGGGIVCSTQNHAMQPRGGTGVAYDNFIPLWSSTNTNGINQPFFAEIWRATAGNVSHPWDYSCGTTPAGGVCSDFRSHCTGGTFPACGAFEQVGQGCSATTCGGGTCGTCVDNPPSSAACGTGNSLIANIDGGGNGGYPCRDQIGVGQDAPDHNSQALAPMYIWNNIDPNNNNRLITAFHNAVTQFLANRDYYISVASFNGTSGVGRGLLSARPATCTPKVGYFATDMNTLYQCSAVNTWTPYYTPFIYPHPLQTGGGPPAPTGLNVSVT